MIKLEMKNLNIKLTEKQQFLTGEEILQSDQSRIIEQVKLKYFPLGKAFENQTKTIEEQGKNK